MPGFIKTKKDEDKWNAIKHSVAKQRGKSVEEFTDRDWATVNAAWHKSEYQDIMKSLMEKQKVAIPKVSMPKPKSMPKPGDKPSVFFKTEIEEFKDVKHPTLCKLRDFLEKQRAKKQS